MPSAPVTAPTAGLENLAPTNVRPDAPAWFQQRSAAAWDEFQSLPMPGNRDEHWRYSSAKRLALDGMQIAPAVNEADKMLAIANSIGIADQHPFVGTSRSPAIKLVFVNDILVHEDTEAVNGGIVCLPFSEALKSQGDVLEQYLMKRKVELGSAKFAALHLAHVRAGVVVLAPKNAVLEHPIEIFHWVSGAGSIIFPHTLIVTGDHAQVTVVDYHGSLRDEATASIAVADFVAGAGSRITYVNVQELSPSSSALHISSTTVNRDAGVKALQLHLGASFARTESVSDLGGEGARSEMLGVSLPVDEQCVDMRTLQHHAAPRTFSDLLYKNALYGKTKTVFAGLISVDHGAHFTDAYQKCRNLLNSADCEADSLPGLEINADQVKCSHGATSAPISDDELFYLKARGITDSESRKLIATGFLEDAIAKLENVALIAELDRRIEQKFALMV